MEKVAINKIELEVHTERIAEVYISTTLDELLSEDNEFDQSDVLCGGHCHRDSYYIEQVLESIENNEIDEEDYTEEDVETLIACKKALDENMIDVVVFNGED